MAERSGFFGWATPTKTAPKTDMQRKPAEKKKPTLLPPYHVVLINDDDHTYEYVIQMLRAVFGYSEERGFQLAKQVDDGGKAIVYTTHRELAELKREQILSHGADFRISNSRGSMSAIIEPG